MSDQRQGPGWWLASDGNWYPPSSDPTAVVQREVVVTCQCSICRVIHSEYLARFGRWPDLGHQASFALARKRLSLEARWAMVTP